MRIILITTILISMSVQSIKSAPTMKLEKIQEWVTGIVDECIESEEATKEDIKNFFDDKPAISKQGKCLKSCLLILFGVMKEDTAEFIEEGKGIFDLIAQFNNESLSTQKEIHKLCSEQVKDEQAQCEKAEKYTNCSISETKKRDLEYDYVLFDISHSIRSSWIQEELFPTKISESRRFILQECKETSMNVSSEFKNYTEFEFEKPAIGKEEKCLKACYMTYFDIMNEDTLVFNLKPVRKWIKFDGQRYTGTKLKAMNDFCNEKLLYEKDKCEKAEKYLNCLQAIYKEVTTSPALKGVYLNWIDPNSPSSNDEDEGIQMSSATEQDHIMNDRNSTETAEWQIDVTFSSRDDDKINNTVSKLTECIHSTHVSKDDFERFLHNKPSIRREGKCFHACLLTKDKVIDPDTAEFNMENFYKLMQSRTSSSKALEIGKRIFQNCSEPLKDEKDVCEKVEKYVNCGVEEYKRIGFLK